MIEQQIEQSFIDKLTEQERIASCLSNLNALKLHKKGLMQKLFPAMDAKAEVEA
jgi:hypothetical protein